MVHVLGVLMNIYEKCFYGEISKLHDLDYPA